MMERILWALIGAGIFFLITASEFVAPQYSQYIHDCGIRLHKVHGGSLTGATIGPGKIGSLCIDDEVEDFEVSGNIIKGTIIKAY